MTLFSEQILSFEIDHSIDLKELEVELKSFDSLDQYLIETGNKGERSEFNVPGKVSDDVTMFLKKTFMTSLALMRNSNKTKPSWKKNARQFIEAPLRLLCSAGVVPAIPCSIIGRVTTHFMFPIVRNVYYSVAKPAIIFSAIPVLWIPRAATACLYGLAVSGGKGIIRQAVKIFGRRMKRSSFLGECKTAWKKTNFFKGIQWPFMTGMYQSTKNGRARVRGWKKMLKIMKKQSVPVK